MRTVIIIQARMGSTRLPGKVLMPLADKTVLAHVVDRCRAVPGSSDVWIATTAKPIDDAIADEAALLGVSCHRGSEDDVLSRYYEAAVASRADVIVRVTSDCPVLDPLITGETIRTFLETSHADYGSNVQQRKFPRGLDTEVFSFSALEKAYHEAKQAYEREHVCPYFYEHPETFRIVSYAPDMPDYSAYRWTLDTPEDYELIQTVYAERYRPNELFGWKSVIELMEEKPHLPLINAHIEQKKV